MYFAYSEYISNLSIMFFMYFVLFYLDLKSVIKLSIIIIVISLSVYSLLYDNKLKEWLCSQNIGSVWTLLYTLKLGEKLDTHHLDKAVYDLCYQYIASSLWPNSDKQFCNVLTGNRKRILCCGVHFVCRCFEFMLSSTFRFFRGCEAACVSKCWCDV